MPSFRALLRQLSKRYDTLQAFADALGIAPSRLTRSMSPRGLPFDINGCLKLAKAMGLPPDQVLRAAGKARTADLIRELYGDDPALARLSDDARELAQLYMAIHPQFADIQRAVLNLLRLVQPINTAHHRKAPAATRHPASAKNHADDERLVRDA